MTEAESQLTPEDQAYFEGIKLEIEQSPDSYGPVVFFDDRGAANFALGVFHNFIDREPSRTSPSQITARLQLEAVNAVLSTAENFSSAYSKYYEQAVDFLQEKIVLDGIRGFERLERERGKSVAIRGSLFAGVILLVYREPLVESYN